MYELSFGMKQSNWPMQSDSLSKSRDSDKLFFLVFCLLVSYLVSGGKIMNTKLFFFAILAAVAMGQLRETISTIDPFTPDTATIVLIIGQDGPLPQTKEQFTQSTTILGGERDLSLTAESGTSNLPLTAGVSAGSWAVSTPNEASGFSRMQYDGVDGSTSLQENGLGGLDMLARGGDAFRLLIQSDIDTEYTITVHSNGGSQSDFSIIIPGDDTTNEYIILFSEFSGNADFSSIGALEILIEAFDNVDTFVEIFEFVGFPPSITPTPSVPLVPSPSASPSPNVVTWYTFDDDDDEGRSPCGDEEPRRTYFLADDNIVYYYFYGFEEPIIESTNGASIMQVSACLFLALFALF